MAEPSFRKMLRGLTHDGELNQADLARGIGISKGRMSELWGGKRRPTVAVANKIVRYVGRDADKAEWHRAAARTHGWKV